MPAANTARSAFSESGPMKCIPEKTNLVLPVRTYSFTSTGSVFSVYSRQNGHCGSANSIIVVGAFGSPRTFRVCGMPLKSATVSAAPGAFATGGGFEPGVVGVVVVVVVGAGDAFVVPLDPRALTSINATAIATAASPAPTKRAFRP